MAADFLDQPRFSRGFLAGVALGVLGLIRVFDPLLFGLPFLFAFVWRAGRRHYVLAPSIIFGGLPFLAALLLFYGITSGSILPKIASSEAPLVKFGLYSVDENGRPHTPLDQLRLAARLMGELAVFTSPLLLLGYLAAFAWKAMKKSLNFFDFIFPVTVAALLLIPFDGGNRYGPRYYFEAYPFLVLTTVSALVPLLQNRARSRRTAALVSLVIGHVAWSIAAAIFLGWLFRGIVDERMDLYDKVRAKCLHDAVIVIHSGTGRFRGFTLNRPRKIQICWRFGGVCERRWAPMLRILLAGSDLELERRRFRPRGGHGECEGPSDAGHAFVPGLAQAADRLGHLSEVSWRVDRPPDEPAKQQIVVELSIS
jgi:hypothetical protein